ncbi:UNVERIFIED_CONTAM: hypothetical protein Scaly_1901500 [Sesamum calycinum]|uniref:MULE transposase domain-containing protein n=1 Tax=Sesamum calycinum TaxID=2727403 RepID=A0AAW2NFR1_9LAMI
MSAEFMSGKAGSEDVSAPRCANVSAITFISTRSGPSSGGIGYFASSGSEASSDSFTKESTVGSSTSFSLGSELDVPAPKSRLEVPAPTNFGAGTSNSEPEYYTPNLVTVTQGLDNIDFHYTEPTQSHTPLSENFIPNENDVEDPTVDSFVNESDEASEPDEAEYPIPPEDGPDRVDINVMAETFAQRGAETSSEPALPDMNTQPTFYRFIPFFQQTFPEIPADSVDVPNLRYAKFYNKSEGRLDKGMLFKTKEELMEAVQDHSIRHARREYYVTESSKTKWKVLYKHNTEEQLCRWEVRGGYKPNIRRWEITQYKETHTCVLNNMSLAHGTIVEWKHKGFQASTGKYVMGYVFWAFKPCIDGFQFCRNVISVDGTHLYTKYKYKLLIAAAMDGNQQVLPLAFAVVDEETYPSWKWFLQQLSRHVIRGRRGMCLISNRHGGLIKAVREGPDFVSPHGVHRYYLRHVCSNFNSTIKNVVLKDLCWQAGSEYQLRKFNRIMDEIKKQDVKAFAYLDQINKEKWTASHDGGWRCGILTTNMSECINGVLKGARRLPSEDYWDDPNFQLVHDPTIRTVTRPGRNQTTRIHNEMDWRQTRARQEAQQQQGDSSIQENVP